MKNKLQWGKSIASFFLVLLMMPLGHAAMIIMEHTLSSSVLHYSAFALGLTGILMVIRSVYVKGDTHQTLWGLTGGMLFWTGWVEFLFQYFANRFGTQPQLDPISGEIVTKPEYLILPATFGLWVMIMVLYVFCCRSGCDFIRWWQKLLLGKRKEEIVSRGVTRHAGIVTFMELVMMMWASYLLLMFCYDDSFIGDHHPVTLIIGLLCLIASVLIFRKQLFIPTWGGNIRMAIATVIVFWTPVEIMGRIKLLNEIWIAPFDHIYEMTSILVAFGLLAVLLIFKTRTPHTT